MRVVGRPFGIIVLVVLSLFGGVWALVGAAGLRPLDEYSFGQIALPPELPLLVTGVWGIFLLVAGVLLFALRRWGWTMLMLSTGLGLFGALWQWWIGSLDPIQMGLLVLTAFYLNGREVRELLLGSRDRAEAAQAPPAGAVPLAPPDGAQG